MTAKLLNPAVGEALARVGVNCREEDGRLAIQPVDELWTQMFERAPDGFWHRWDNGQWAKDINAVWMGSTTNWTIIEASLIWRYYAQIRANVSPSGARVRPFYMQDQRIIDPETHGYPAFPEPFEPMIYTSADREYPAAGLDGRLVATWGFARYTSLYSWHATPEALLAELELPNGGELFVPVEVDH